MWFLSSSKGTRFDKRRPELVVGLSAQSYLFPRQTGR
jgi:hypothetical protein